MTNNTPLFANRNKPRKKKPVACGYWRVLIVDDEKEVHAVTKVALSDFIFANAGLELVHANSGSEAIEIMRANDDIAVILMDVVMETETAGLDAIRVIRRDLGNSMVRIILRTGQPGQAPEREVITNYDINDYKAKTELTAVKLYSVVLAALRSYRDLSALERNRVGLKKVIDSSASLLEERSIRNFAQGVLEQLSALMYAGRDAVMVQSEGLAASRESASELKILAGTGRFGGLADAGGVGNLDGTVQQRVLQGMDGSHPQYQSDHFVYHLETASGRELIFYLDTQGALEEDDRQIIELFSRNVAICFENLALNDQLQQAQQELVLVLSEAIEKRSAETGNHVRRVAAYSALLGELYGLPAEQVETLRLASPLHDVGKVAIPDAILNKPGRHEPDETTIMRTHAQIGGDIFQGYAMSVLHAAGIVANEHHEQWDGQGYPQGKSGEEIHIFGRIVSLTDVFDALLSPRCYKEPWPHERVVAHIREQRGQHFEPRLVDLLLENLDKFEAIRQELAD